MRRTCLNIFGSRFLNKNNKALLIRYLKLYSFRIHKAQAMLTRNIDIRSRYPWFFTQRDPHDPAMQKIIETFDMVLLQQHTPENYKVCIARLVHSDHSEIVLNDLTKMYLMTCDVRFHLPVADYRKMESGEIIIFDMKNFTLKHLTKAVVSTLKFISKYLQTAHPVRLVQFHVINCTPIVNRALLFIRPFIYAKLYNTLHFHKVGSLENLYNYIPREMLPSDYGGSAPSMNELKKYWYGVLETYRPFVMNDDYWKPDGNNI
ncbi:alpha-tocopherol transfer protein-like [Chironomus tepperi]|uniref:alpha-tocopherol transfer protein-like n=1 Tax=Chironomus tepperi TaxID=113505 RepID=UPI00391FAB7B